MRQPSIILLTLITICLCASPAYAAVKGGIAYSIPPIDYTKLSEPELVGKASKAYFNAMRANDKENEEVTNALVLYSLLQNMNPTEQEYCIKLGILYDKIGLDRYARGNFSRAIGINSTAPAPYFYLGEFYYKREMYRKALKYYTSAYDKGYTTHYETLYKLGDIYQKLGDTRSALKYLKAAAAQSPNSSLDVKIKRVESEDSINSGYYR